MSCIRRGIVKQGGESLVIILLNLAGFEYVHANNGGLRS
jgi:hypothetical protein